MQSPNSLNIVWQFLGFLDQFVIFFLLVGSERTLVARIVSVGGVVDIFVFLKVWKSQKKSVKRWKNKGEHTMNDNKCMVAKKGVGMACGGSSGAAVAALDLAWTMLVTLGGKDTAVTLCMWIHRYNGVCQRHGDVVWRWGLGEGGKGGSCATLGGGGCRSYNLLTKGEKGLSEKIFLFFFGDVMGSETSDWLSLSSTYPLGFWAKMKANI